MQKALTHLFLAKLAPQEVEAFRPGLEAIQDFASKNEVRVWVDDVKHKRSGPVISCYVEYRHDLDIAVEEVFETAMKEVAATKR